MECFETFNGIKCKDIAVVDNITGQLSGDVETAKAVNRCQHHYDIEIKRIHNVIAKSAINLESIPIPDSDYIVTSGPYNNPRGCRDATGVNGDTVVSKDGTMTVLAKKWDFLLISDSPYSPYYMPS